MARAMRGRPPKPAQERKRANLTFRVRDQLRETLKQQADREGRSISEEIEHRIERTMIEDAALGGSVHLKLMFETVMSALRVFELATGGTPFGPDGNRWVHTQLRNAIEDWLDRTEPKGAHEPPAGLSALGFPPQDIAETFLGMVDELTRGPSDGPHPYTQVARVRDLFVEAVRLLGDNRPQWEFAEKGEQK